MTHRLFDLKTVWQKVRHYLFGKMFGSIEYAKSKLLMTFQGSEEIFLKGEDHNRIQAFWIPCPQHLQGSEKVLSTAILCGQNAKIAEYDGFGSQLISFYHEHSCNVITYNYRGVSLSTGAPSIANLKKDAVTVANFARSLSGWEGKLLAHGTSLGGCAASFLARVGAVDCVVCDRTFGSLD
jgi:hypothetical protein